MTSKMPDHKNADLNRNYLSALLNEAAEQADRDGFAVTLVENLRELARAVKQGLHDG